MQLVEAAVEEMVHKRFPHLPLPPPGAANCTGDGYLTQAGLMPVAYGGLGGYFGILSGYCVAVHAIAYGVLCWRTSRMHSE